MQESGSGTTRAIGTAAWVLVVVAVGLLIGVLLALATPPHPGPPGPGGPLGAPAPLGRAATVLSGLDAALLAALIVVYARTYWETRARFALGLVVFLGALLLQALASSPAVFGAFGLGPGGLGGFLFLSTLFEAIALVAFLWLSLE
jgi:hypothetical protein